MVEIAVDHRSEAARWKRKCLEALEANEQFSVLAKGRVSDLAHLLGRLARALPPGKANAALAKDLSRMSQTLCSRPFDEELNDDIRAGYKRLLKVVEAHEAEQSTLLSALKEAVTELEKLAGSWLLKRRLRRFQKTLQTKDSSSISNLVEELKDLQKATLKSLAKAAENTALGKENPDQPVPGNSSEMDDLQPVEEPGKIADLSLERDSEPAVGHQSQTSGSGTGVIPTRNEQSVDWLAVQKVLLGLLERVETAREASKQIQQLRQQVMAGMDDQSLVPLLQRVRDLFDASLTDLRGEYRLFLDAVDQRLGGLLSGLNNAQVHSQEVVSRRNEFTQGIETGFANMRHQAGAAENLASLKNSIEDNLQHLGQVLNDYSIESDAQAARAEEQLKTMSERLAQLETESQAARQQLDQQHCLAFTDSLTGMPNRRALDQRMEHEYAQWQRYGAPLTIAMLDIDHFKWVNDEHGHVGGDRALELIANILKNRIRQVDFAARFGGEEFVIVMPSTTQARAGEMLEQIRCFIEECGFNYQGQHVQITASCGFSEVREGDEVMAALERADAALYQAKEAGRNKIVCAA